MANTQKRHWLDVSYATLTLSALVTVVVVYITYTQTQLILKDRLKERLIAIASTAAVQIEPKELSKIIKEDKESAELRKVVTTLRKVRDANRNLRYIYIWSKTDDPKFLKFAADAEMLDPIDENGDGIIDGDETPPAPGEPYEIEQVPNSENLFVRPFAQDEFIEDKWGTFLSGFSPIYNEKGFPIAVLGIDVEVDDFNVLIRATLLPFLVLAVFLLLMLSLQTVALIKIWRSRVEIVIESERQKDELLGIVSHQLATPISSVKWYVEMMKDGDLGVISKEQQEHLNTMSTVISSLTDLVGMILDVSRIQLGRLQTNKANCSLNEFLEEILQVIEVKAKEKKVHLIKNTPKKDIKVNMDKKLTRMAVENILSNAIKYSPTEKTVKFEVKVENNILSVTVKDEGMGIPVSDQPKIFGKLFRAKNAATIDGNGFGLYVAKGGIEAQNGKIWFESTEGKGTKFFIELPV